MKEEKKVVNEVEKKIEFDPATPIGSFSTELMSRYADANISITFHKYTPTNEQNTPENRIIQQENGSFFIPDNVTFQDLMFLSQIIIPNDKNKKNDPIDNFTKKLQDVAILMSKEHTFQDKVFNQFIEEVYNFGASLAQNKVRRANDNPFIRKTREEIQKIAIQNPLGMGERKDTQYQNNLYLFLLGKETYFHSLVKDKKHPNDVQNTFYSKLFSHWRRVHNVEIIDDQAQSKFDIYLLSRPSLLAPFLQNGISKPLGEKKYSNWRILNKILKNMNRNEIKKPKSSSHTLESLNLVTEQIAERELEFAIAVKRNEQIKKYLPLPPIKYLNEDIRALLREVHGEDISYKKLFEIIGPLYDIFLMRNGNDKNIEEKLRFFWEFVQAYPFKETYHPSEMYSGEFECNLKVLVLGLLYEEYLRNEIIILGDIIKKHVFLTILPKNLSTADSVLNYSIDPSYQRENGYSFYGQAIHPIINGKIIKALEKFRSINMLTTTITVQKDEINISDNPNESDFGLQTHHFADFILATNNVIWQNLNIQKSISIMNFTKAKKQLELDPYYGIFWHELLLQLDQFKNSETANSENYSISEKDIAEHARRLELDQIIILFDLYYYADNDKADEILDFIMKEKMSNAPVGEWILLGNSQYSKTESESVFREALKKFPSNFQLCLTMGEIKITENKLFEAAEFIITCNNIMPEDSELLEVKVKFYQKIRTKKQLINIQEITHSNLFKEEEWNKSRK